MLKQNDNIRNEPRLPPTIFQTNRSNNSEKIGFVKNYVYSISGLLRFGIILFQFAGWVSAASIPKYYNQRTYLPPDMAASRDAYLFFSIIGFIIAIIIYLTNLFNIGSIKPLSKFPINLLILVSDIIWLIPTFILAIVCAVREGSIKDPTYVYSMFFNSGAFASASAFAFLCSFLYAIDAVFHLMKQIRPQN